MVESASDATVVYLDEYPGVAGAQWRARRRADARRRHASVPPRRAGGACGHHTASVIDRRDAFCAKIDVPAPAADLAQRFTAVAKFIRKRLTGDYSVDEFGFDPHLTDTVVLPVLRTFFRSWFRVETSGIENLPDAGAALLVANHAGVLPLDGLMAAVAVHDDHPAQRMLRVLANDVVVRTPLLGPAARKAGQTRACATDADQLLSRGELAVVFPEGYQGLGKRFSQRYTLRSFGDGQCVSAALRNKAPIIPCSIVGSEEIYPMIGDLTPLARLLKLPYFPITPLFPLAGAAGLIPLPSKWHIKFGAPIPTAEFDDSAASDPMVVAELAGQVRDTIQGTLRQLQGQRRNIFLG